MKDTLPRDLIHAAVLGGCVLGALRRVARVGCICLSYRRVTGSQGQGDNR